MKNIEADVGHNMVIKNVFHELYIKELFIYIHMWHLVRNSAHIKIYVRQAPKVATAIQNQIKKPDIPDYNLEANDFLIHVKAKKNK